MAADGSGGSNPNELAIPSTVARLNYFYGQLLAQADLKAEQQYHVLLRRLLQRETFGTGTVAGLRVDAGSGPTARAVFVRSGLAMDPDGRELLLLADACFVVVPPALKPSITTPFSATDADALAAQVAAAFGAPIDGDAILRLAQRLIDAGMTEVTITGDDTNLKDVLNQLTVAPVVLADGQTLEQWLFDAIVGMTYLGARYLERGADPGPSILDGSCCGETPCSPTRLREGLTLVMSTLPFVVDTTPYDRARDAFVECVDASSHPPGECLADYILEDGTWRPLPASPTPCPTSLLPIVPLAVVLWARYPRIAPATSSGPILSIDNVATRPLAPSPVVSRALLDVLVQRSGTGIKDHLRDHDAIVVHPDYQYLLHGPLTIDPGATFAVMPGASLVII